MSQEDERTQGCIQSCWQVAVSELLQGQSALVLLALIVHHKLLLAGRKHRTRLTIVLRHCWRSAHADTTVGVMSSACLPPHFTQILCYCLGSAYRGCVGSD